MNQSKNLKLARIALKSTLVPTPQVDASQELDGDSQDVLDVMTWIGQTVAELPSVQVVLGDQLDGPTNRPKKSKRLIALAVLLIVVFSGGGVAAYQYLFQSTLLSDDFQGGWFDSDKWLPPPENIKDGGIRAELGHLRMVNRGYIVPRREFPEPIQIDLEWKWNQLGLNPLYSDILTIALRTDGTARKYSHDVEEGILVQFNAWGSFIQIATPDGKLLATTSKSETLKIHAMPAEQWHKVRVIDDGKSIHASFSAQGNSIDSLEETVLVYEVKENLGGKRFAIYNRELVAFPHESCIRNLTVKQIKE